MVAIKGNHLSMVRYLVDGLKANHHQLGRFIWRGLDSADIPPLFAAIFCDKSLSSTVDFLIERDLSNNCTPGCIDDILLSTSLTRAMKTDALKILGAAFFFAGGIPSFLAGQIGIDFWSAATSVRPDEDSANPAAPLSIQKTEWARKFFENFSEIATFEELGEICNRPPRVNSISKHKPF